MDTPTQTQDVKSLVKRLGGPSCIARHLGITHGAVCQWPEIPVGYVPDLVELSMLRGDPVCAEEMRPDKPWRLVCEVKSLTL